MRKSRLLGIALACAPFIVPIPTSAATYSIIFYEFTGDANGGLNLFDDYTVSGTATFEINDAAVGPNNLVLFSDSENFLAFDAVLNTSLASAQFTLGIDDFPPFGDGTGLNTHEQGILFDASGQPLRFDVPTLSFGNGAQICDPQCDISIINKQNLTLWDDDGFDSVVLDDGSITTLGNAQTNGFNYVRLSGEWDLGSFGSSGGDGFYQIQAVPVPAAVWLFGSGLIGLIGIARRKTTA